MAKIIVLFGKPNNPAEFDEKYWKEHVPLAKKLPELKKYTINKIVTLGRREPAYYLMAEMEFESMDALKKALESPASKESGKHAVELATGGITFLYAESKEA